MPTPARLLLHAALLLPLLAQAAVPTAPVEAPGTDGVYLADGIVEAIRQTTLAAQVPGRVTTLAVKAGDAVRAGQVLLRIDARAAAQQAVASDAQAAAAQAQLEAARREYERSQRLAQKKYISQAALEQAEAQFRATEAQVRAALAQADAARTQTGFHVVTAPFAGVVAAVTTELGDMAAPGKPLATLYDPAALRVVATVPEGAIGRLRSGAAVAVAIPTFMERTLDATRVTVLPTRDPATHTVQVRLELPGGTRVAPGAYAQARFPIATTERDATLTVPAAALVKRGELTAVYVADGQGGFRLRQVRPGRVVGERVVVLAGLEAGERVALDPVAAARR